MDVFGNFNFFHNLLIFYNYVFGLFLCNDNVRCLSVFLGLLIDELDFWQEELFAVLIWELSTHGHRSSFSLIFGRIVTHFSRVLSCEARKVEEPNLSADNTKAAFLSRYLDHLMGCVARGDRHANNRFLVSIWQVAFARAIVLDGSIFELFLFGVMIGWVAKALNIFKASIYFLVALLIILGHDTKLGKCECIIVVCKHPWLPSGQIALHFKFFPTLNAHTTCAWTSQVAVQLKQWAILL